MQFAQATGEDRDELKKLVRRKQEDLETYKRRTNREETKSFPESPAERKAAERKVYASEEECFPLFPRDPNSPSLRMTHCSARAQGPRSGMEDADFIIEDDLKIVAGVFDGHSGDQVANHASKIFQKSFFEILKAADGNVHQAFEQILHQIHEEGIKISSWDDVGTTALITFIDKQNGEVWTATVGDSEANIYRVFNQELKSISLSNKKDWGDEKEADRAFKALKREDIKSWPQYIEPKTLRFPGLGIYPGLNMSRALCDKNISTCTSTETLGLIHKSKITLQQLQPGDILVLACDGLKDYVSEDKIVQKIQEAAGSENLAQELVDYAIEGMDTWNGDNVTIIVIKVPEEEASSENIA